MLCVYISGLLCYAMRDLKPKIQVYKDKSGKWGYRIKAQNGRIMAVNFKGYSTKSKALRALGVVDNIFNKGWLWEMIQ